MSPAWPPPFGYSAYEPPPSQRGRPAIILWYRIFALTSVMVYAGILLIWQFVAPKSASDPHAWGPLLAITTPFILFNLVGALVPYRPWGWTYGVVTIGFGMLTCMFPFSIVLLIFWSRPRVKAAFGRF